MIYKQNENYVEDCDRYVENTLTVIESLEKELIGLYFSFLHRNLQNQCAIDNLLIKW